MSETFGKKLRELRRRAGLTQQAFSERLQLHEQTVCRGCHTDMVFPMEYVLLSNKTYAIWKYTGNDDTVVLPQYYLGVPITHLGGHAFESSYVKTVVIPEGYQVIEGYAFRYCHALAEVQLPSTLQKIGQEAFGDCTALTQLTIPDNVTEMRYSVFAGCTGLSSVTLGSGVTEVPESCFCGCTALSSVTIRGAITKIGAAAFGYCAFTEIAIPSTVKTIEQAAFAYCKNLKSIVIPDSVTRVGMDCFSDCSALTIYYGGTQDKWRALRLDGLATVLFYSQSEPAEEGNFWHYVGGVATPWKKEN